MKELIRLMWKIQTLQFDYPFHARRSIVLWHVVIVVSSLSACYVCKYIGLIAILGMVSWNYIFFFDKRRFVYIDSYKPLGYERLGTHSATVLLSVIILRFMI